MPKMRWGVKIPENVIRYKLMIPYGYQIFQSHHVRSGSPANFQNPECPKTGRFLSLTSDFKKSKKKIENRNFQDLFFLLLFNFDTKFVFYEN